MGKKCIIEMKEGERLYKTKLNALNEPVIREITCEPYTEPDMEQVRKEAYDKGYDDATAEIGSDEQAIAEKAYQKGLSDAWGAAREIGSNSMCSLERMGFDFGQCIVDDYNPSWFVVKNYSASEAIEKIRAYEQKQEQIRVGNEVEMDCPDLFAIYMGGVNGNENAVYLLFDDGSCGIHVRSEIKRKTGRHFPEIVEVLRKMKES